MFTSHINNVDHMSQILAQVQQRFQLLDSNRLLKHILNSKALYLTHEFRGRECCEEHISRLFNHKIYTSLRLNTEKVLYLL